MAYQRNPQLLAERQRQRVTDEGVPTALSGWRPVVTLSTGIGRTQEDRRLPELAGGTTILSDTRLGRDLTLSLTQLLYRGGRTLADVSRAENEVKGGLARLTAVEQTVLLDAATAFSNLVRDREVLRHTRENVRLLEQIQTATQARLREGEATRTDVAQARSRLVQAMARRAEAEAQVVATGANFERVVGIAPPGQPLRQGVPNSLPASDADAVARVANSPVVTSAQFIEAAARDSVDLVFGELLPVLNLTGSASRAENLTAGEDRRETADIQLRLSVPLYQQGLVVARLRSAKETASQRRIEVVDVRNRVEEEARCLHMAHQVALEPVNAF